MRVLIACEFSGVVREAFAAKGHTAFSCDLEPTEIPGWHFMQDVRDVIYDGWDLMVAHPPCTHLCVSGARWWPGNEEFQTDALNFVMELMHAPIPRIAIENPIGKISTTIRKPDQIVHPYWFGHDERKSTCLWLKNLPLLEPTNLIPDGKACSASSIHRERPGKFRSKDRSITYQGLANAMADQWSFQVADK